MYLQLLMMDSKIFLDHWLPQATRIWLFVVFQYRNSFGGRWKSGWIICHIRVHFDSRKNTPPSLNPRNTLSASAPMSWLTRVGFVSDSCIQTGIIRSLLAKTTERAPGHHFENTRSGFSLSRIFLAWNVPIIRYNGQRRVIGEVIETSLMSAMEKKSTFSRAASFSSMLFAQPIQIYFSRWLWCWWMSETIGVTCHPVPPQTNAILENRARLILSI